MTKLFVVLKFAVVDDISDGASDPATVSSLCQETTCSRREYKSILLIFEFYYGFFIQISNITYLRYSIDKVVVRIS